jgi:hypothetical protein
LNYRRRKSPRQHISRRNGIIDSFRPLTFDAAGNLDLDVEHVMLFPDGDTIVLSVVTGRGTATFCMPPLLAHEVGDGLMWLVNDTKSKRRENTR